MTTRKIDEPPGEERDFVPGEELSHTEVLRQLDRIATSTYFKHSKRYPSFLRFVVEHTLAGNTDVLKERTLGTEVFARPSEYDTNADPIVRVTAGEIRKRIAQYYQAPGHEHELRIDLPLGSYVPRFLAASAAAQLSEHEGADRHQGLPALHASADGHEAPVGEHSPAAIDPDTAQSAQRAAEYARRIRVMLFSGLALLLLLGIAVVSVNYVRTQAATHALRDFWEPILSSKSPVLIVMGVHTLDNKGDSLPTVPTGDITNPANDPKQNVLSTMEYDDMVPVSDIVSYSKLTNLLTQNSHLYQTKSSTTTTFQDLQHGPVVLVGGLDNIWAIRLTSGLRYRFFSAGTSKYGIRDSKDPARVWTVDYLQPVLNNSRDYAVVASYFDPMIEQRVLIAAGVGKNGTVAATDFLTVEKYMNDWSSAAGQPRKQNVELVLETEILDGQPGPPHVLASYTW